MLNAYIYVRRAMFDVDLHVCMRIYKVLCVAMFFSFALLILRLFR